ncbi:transposase [Cryobacterium sp. N21]|uniref:transposase n=1 Tax=Cryobacterium sp. N21 TaxID=2048289 RepID=UPI000CE4C10D|nr:transposase [Cryobacterium sp. N21]
MGKTRREFAPGYKDEAVKLVINTGRAIATVARELGINEASPGRWVSAFKARNDTAGLIRLDKFSEHDWLVVRDNFRHRVRP